MLRRPIIRVSSTIPQRLASAPTCFGALTTQRRWKTEAEEELEREQQLRQQIKNKMGTQQSAPATGGWGSWFATQTAAEKKWENFNYETASPEQQGAYRAYRFSLRLWLFILYGTAAYSFAVLWQLRDDQSPVSLMQGMPPWACSGETTAYYILLRSVASYREQGQLQGEYGLYASAQGKSFAEFMAERYPSMFDGHRTSSRELVALIGAAFAIKGDMGIMPLIARAMTSRDRKANMDSIADAIRRDYPQAQGFANSSLQGASYSQQQQAWYQQQQQQYYQQQQQQYMQYQQWAQQQQQQQQQQNGQQQSGQSGSVPFEGNPNQQQQQEQGQQQQQERQPTEQQPSSSASETSSKSN